MTVESQSVQPLLSPARRRLIMVIDSQASYTQSLPVPSKGANLLLSTEFVPMASRKGASSFSLNYKTRLCLNWEIGFCEFGEKCAFAHGAEELRETVQKSIKYKTKRCKQYFDLGYCVYGSRCQFIHEGTRTLKDLPTAANSRRNSVEDSGFGRLPVFMRLAEGESLCLEC